MNFRTRALAAATLRDKRCIMMAMKISAGIVLYRLPFQVLLVHPGGPFWKNKDVWSIPKGELAEGEEPLAAALREFEEELGIAPPAGPCLELQPIRQKGGKQVLAWACRGDLDAQAIRSNTFEMEWPPRSGKRTLFPEVDRAAWFAMEDARLKILPAQLPLLEELLRKIGAG